MSSSNLAKKTPTATVELVNDRAPALPIERQLEAHWSQAEHWLKAIKLMEVGRLAAQVMAGFELIQLHEFYKVQAGRPKKEFFHGERISWSDVVGERLGLSESTAWRWMEMAKAARPRLKKLGAGFGEIVELMLTNPAAVNPEQLETVRGAVAKLTDGYTQMEFMEELGLIKAAQGSKTRGGATTKALDEGTLTPAEVLELKKVAARAYWSREVKGLHDELIVKQSWQYLPHTIADQDDAANPTLTLEEVRVLLTETLKGINATLGRKA